ncbi:uncharacterized protein FMAN_03876 [Fusarium mangiferae]|uniref:Uncharacterized protein n=1 Tax=Fusarium mangiferae TaxID=192010 RepID=A0A1L7UEK7_FUSMA|nr:uncharacterized protein FMAN_03876 [Fusarium mangiferae]CVL06137.1 uncharacterized protein FMAN_03876 [Fusarium mangiferae]
MTPSQSHLSNSKYGYDFVVATTQESINAGLVQYLQNTGRTQDYTYLCFLADQNGDPTSEVPLEDVVRLSGGISPFDIPDGTDWEDERIQKMYQVRLICAIRMRSGIPPGCVVNVPNKGPQINLPEPIVNLGKTSESVTFNMYCSDITIIKNSVPSGWGSKGSWKWFSQPPGKPWYVKTQTNLLNSELDRNLNTPYFNAHPAERDALRLRLDNISDSAFSLQQLLFNLDNAIAQSVPTFVGVTDETASYLLGKSFINIWSKIAKQYGLPLIGVTAVAQHPDGSPLRLTALERWVSPVVDSSSGEQIKNPSDLEIAATTLNYLCATDGHRLPGPSSFTWNWIEPRDLAQSSGVISIKRDTMARYLVDQILPQVRSSCIKPNEPHTVEIPPSGPLVAKLDYSFSVRADDHYALPYGELKISSTYSCTIVFGNYDQTKNPPVYVGGNTFTVVQGLWIWVFVQWAASKADAYVVNQIRSDEFVISVDENGGLTSSTTNNSTMTDSAGDIKIGFADKFVGLQTRLRNIKNTISALPNASLKSLPFNSIKNFVFPGAKVFSYKDASFSNHSDLACCITYVSPTEDPWKLMRSDPSHRTDDPPETIYLDEVPSLAAFVLQLRAGELKRLEEENMAEKPPLPIEDSTLMNADRLGISVAQNGDKNSNVEGMSTTLEHPPPAEKVNSKRRQERAVITSSTELMLNYVQGELVNPEGEFRALQTANGTALLFAIDSSGVFNVFEETVAEIRTGWRATNLSTKIINEKFSSGAKAVHFDVGQSVMNNHTISLAMAVRSNGSDNLFLSLNNSPSSTSQWISNPDWTSFPFDAQNRPSSIQITGIYISETDQQQQYIMVDILRNPNSDLKATSRYIVDPFSTGVHWMPHTLPFEVEQGTYQSCVGRVPGAFVDGIYTAGSVKGVAQMSYVPLFNSSGSAAPMPTRLPLLNKVLATAIASARYTDGTTDFYAVNDSTLYRWSSNQQLRDNTVGTALLTNPVFAGTDTLIALIHDGITTIFGKNSSDAVYYTSCQIDHLAKPMLWSAPVPVLHGIERITSFINLKDGGNTVFAAGANRIDKLTQATNTESKLWRAQSIMLEASPQSKPMSFTSYTTTIIVKGPDGHRLTEGEILLSTVARTPVYIDGIYYILSTTPVTVPVGVSGQVMVIQATDSIVGSTISVRLGEAEHVVNPMAISFDKLAKLSTKDALKNAQIRTNTVAGGVTGSSSTDPLVLSSVSDSDLDATAQNMKLLTDTYKVNRSRASQASLDMTAPVISMVVSQGSKVSGFGDDIAIAIGDLFNWLKTEVEKVVDFVKNAATGLWDFVVKIGNDIYRALLDRVDAVVGAVEWVFDKIKTGVSKVLRYLEFLFDWDDIRRTKQVAHNMVKYCLVDMVSGIQTAKGELDECIGEAQKAVAEWSGIKDWSGLGDAASKPPSRTVVDTTKSETAGSQMMVGHLKNQANNIMIQGSMPEPSLVQGLVDDMIAALEAEGLVFLQAFRQLQDLAKEFSTLSLADILRRLVGILAEGILGTTKVVVDALLDVLHRLAGTVVDMLDTKIHIPIISDILNLIGVPDISFLDLFLWIGAAGITVIYKIGTGEAPFADNATTRALISATDWASFSAVVKQPPRLSSDEKHDGTSRLSVPREIGRIIYVVGHGLAGFILMAGTFIFYPEAIDPDPQNPRRIPAALLGAAGAVTLVATDFLFATIPLENQFISTLRKVTGLVTVLFKCVFCGPAQKFFDKYQFLKVLTAADPRKISSIFDMVVAAPAFFCVFYHFQELSEKPASSDKTLAIMEETSRMMAVLARVSYTVAVNAPTRVPKVIAASSMSACHVVTGALELTCSAMMWD